MFSSLILTFVSTTVIGGIVYIIFNLVFNSNFEDKEQESNKTDDNEFIDNRHQEKDCFVETQNGSKIEEFVSEEVIKSDKPLNAEKPIELSSKTNLEYEVPTSETSNQKNERTDHSYFDQIEDLLDFEEVIKEANEFLNEKPNEVINELVIEDVLQTNENQFKSEFNSDEPIVKDHIHEEVNEEPFKRQDAIDLEDSKDLKDQFWSLEETQNLKHLNKSRPKKHKSRPSIKVVFTDDSNDEKSDEKITEDPISINARELVDTLFETLGSDVEEYKNRSDSGENISPKDEANEEQNIFESKVCETNETIVSKNDDTFEEISSGEYKKFDEFSDYFRSETRKHEISRKVYEISSVKNYEITVNSGQELNGDMIDDLLKNYEAIDGKTEVFEENYNKVSESETIQVRKGEQTTGVVPISKSETVSHTKSFNERTLSSSSLSKMSLEDLDLNLKSSKSRFSETIDTVTKPLLSSPTLFRRSVISSEEEPGAEAETNESPKRIQLPLFGKSQSMLMKEMKDREFRKSLKPLNDSKNSDKNISNQ